MIDTNPDLKRQFLRNNLDYRNIDYIFITHTHTDHIN
ncbi:MBL fold metallo-hydrolase [bacterium]|nr:MBL fold metallo-hydrolase [bacterium]